MNYNEAQAPYTHPCRAYLSQIFVDLINCSWAQNQVFADLINYSLALTGREFGHSEQ